MKNIETPDKKHLESIITDLREGKFGIPDFQRDFEWNPWDVIELIKSIFEDYYIGTLLLWKASRENIEYLSCKPIYGSKDDGKFQHIVLDGQQRLSALYYALFAPNVNFPRRKSKYYYVINIEKLLDENFDEAFDYIISSRKTDELIGNEKLQFEKKIFPLKIFGERSHFWSRWLENYQKYWEQEGYKNQAAEEREKLEKILESILNEYYISYIELDREIEVEKVCDIFQRINSTGLDLNIFDLMNALLRPKDIRLKSLWKKEINDFQSKLPDVDKGKIYTLQTMSILRQAYCAPKFLYYLVPNSKKLIKEESGSLKKIVLIESKEQFLELWNSSLCEMKNALKIISNHSDLGVISPKFFPYPTMLPIFTALNIEKARDIYTDKKGVEEKIRYWYWSSIFTKNYSSSVESRIAKDFLEIKKWFLDDKMVPTVVVEARKAVENINLEGEDNQSSSIYKAIFCVIVKEGALDFVSYEAPVYLELEDHHIVPKSWGISNKVEQINSILNRTPISDISNKKIIRNNLPNIYIKDMFDKAERKEDVYELLQAHMISQKAVNILLRDNFTGDDFLEFIDERKKTLLTKIKKLVGCELSVEEQIQKDPNEVLKAVEIRIRNFIDFVLQKNIGPDYWVNAIPQHINSKVDSRLSVTQNNVPYAAEIINLRKKLDYLDMTEYCDIILNNNNWTYFEKYFLNKENTAKHFKHLSDFRNPIKHIREKQEVTDKLGEAAIIWLNGVINKGLVEDKDIEEENSPSEASNSHPDTKLFWEDIKKFSENMALVTYGKEEKGILKLSLKVNSRFKTQITLFRLKTNGDIKFFFGEIEKKNLPEDIISGVKNKIINLFNNEVNRINASGTYYFNVNKILNEPEKINNFKEVIRGFVKKVSKQ